MASPARGRLSWNVLLLVLLLVAPFDLPAPPGLLSTRSGGTTVRSSYWGIGTVDANLVGQLIVDNALVDLQWGQIGGFAGFSGLSLARSDCSDLYDPENPMYTNSTEADEVLTGTVNGISAYNLFKATDNVVGGIDKFSAALGYGNNAALALYWLPYWGARLGCGASVYENQEDEDESPPEPAAAPPEKTGVFYDMWAATKTLYARAQANPAFNPLLSTARYAVSTFITPMKQAGVIIKIVGKATGQSGAEKGGKVVEELMDEPEEKLKTVIGTTNKWCKAANTYLTNWQKRVLDPLDVISNVLSVVETFAIIPWSYGGCALQKDLLRKAINEVRAGTSQSPSGRRLLQSDGVQSLTAFRAETEEILQASEDFLNIMQSISNSFNNTVTPPLTTAYNTWTEVNSAVETVADAVSEAVTFFNFMPTWLSSAIFGLADKLSFVAECPDWVCGLFSWVGDLVDWATEELIKAMNIPGVETLEDLFIKALEEFGVPVPDWWRDGFGVDLPFDDEIGLFGFIDDITNAANVLKAEVEDSINDLITKVLTLTPSVDDGTRIIDVNSASTTQVKRRISTTSATTIDIKCPTGTAAIYMDSFTLLALPDCNADYTAWLRFPCNGSTSCTVDWTRYDWKCLEYQNSFSGVAGLGIPQRYVTAVYDCVTAAGLANYTLLPELLSASKLGSTTLPNVDYSSTSDLATVNVLKGFAQGIGNLGSIDSSLIPVPKPGLRSNAAANPSVAAAAAPFDAYSQGRLTYPLLNPFFERTGYTPVDYSCTGAAAFGLPSLLIEGTDVDACYDTAYWNSLIAAYPSSRGNTYDSTYDVRYWRILVQSQVEALRSDMCGWRMVSKRGYIGALKGATQTTLQSMVPPMLLPWSGPPTEQQFKDFWGARGACEHFSDGGSGRSHLSHSTWKVTRPSTATECGLLVTAPTCYPGRFPRNPSSDSSTWSQNVVCDTNSVPQNSQWPLVSPTADPVLKTAAVPASVCGNNVPNTQSPNACFSSSPSWCGPRGRFTTGSDPTPDVDSNLNTDFFSQMTYYFANLSTTTVANAQFTVNLATPARQWAAECSLDFIRGQEYAARKALLDAHAARQSTTLDQTCADALATCQLTKGACPVSELFRCSKLLGIIQYACIPDPATLSGSTMTLVFKVSLTNGAKQIGCGANQVLQIVSAEVGAGRTIKDAMVAVVQSMCNTNGTSCNLDINNAALNATGANDVLKVLWRCACVPGFEDGAVNGTCRACEAGSYRGSNSSVCTLTPPGSYTNDTGSTAPTLCPAGTYAANYGQVDCTLCPALTYSTAIGATNASTCIACVGANTFSPPGASQCSTCSAGTALIVSTTNTTNGTAVTSTCVDCPPGTYRTESDDKCTACDPGTYAPYSGTNTSCTAAPAGSYAALPGTINPTPCEQGSYQPTPGSTSCLKCSDGTTTNATGSTEASACTPSSAVPASELPRLQALANTPADGSTGRKLKEVTDPTGPCGVLASALADLGLTANASTFLSEVGNSYCSPTPWLNSPACNYDGGDCCPSTCQPLCEQMTSSDNSSETVATYISLAWSCSKFQCRDPAATGNNTQASINCTGIAVSKPNSLLQRLLLPVIQSDVVNVEEVLNSIAPAKEGPAEGTPGVCDAHLNTESNEWDNGDCCEDSCQPNLSVPGSCTSIPTAACLDPKYSSPDPEQPPSDVVPPVLIAPADYTTTCGATIVGTAGLTAYDKVDGIIPLSNPAISSSEPQLSVSLTQPLPCPSSETVYTVSLTWTATDKAGNTANATQTVYVLPPPAVLSCSGNPTHPANSEEFSCTTTAAGGNCSTVCKTGYTLTSGNLTAVCSNDDVPVWSNVTGVCSPAACTGPGPKAPANATSYNCSTTPSGSNCSTTCLAGFELAVGGSLQITCSLGNWSNADGACAELGCRGTPGPTAPPNARPFNCSSTSPGDSCSTECADDYTQQGSLTAICAKGAWSPVTGSCVEKNCTGPVPDAPQNAQPFVCPNKLAGSTCSTTCASGFLLQTGGSLTITCSKGAWSTANGVCVAGGCTTQPNAPPGAVSYYYTCRLPVSSGGTCSTVCDPRFVLARGNLTVTCSLGMWSTPSGVCAVLPTQPGCGKTCLCPTKSACLNGAPKKKCSWSDAAQKCFVTPPPLAPAGCTTQPNAPPGAVSYYYTCRLPVSSGGTCSTVCDPRFVLARGNLTVTCSLGMWSTPSGVCAVLPTHPGCSKTCLCPSKSACLNGAPKKKCSWSDAAQKCFVTPPP